MKVYELLATLEKLENDKKRVMDKRPTTCDEDTVVELNYFKDVLPLLADVDELKFMLQRLEVDYACQGIGKKEQIWRD